MKKVAAIVLVLIMLMSAVLPVYAETVVSSGEHNISVIAKNVFEDEEGAYYVDLVWGSFEFEYVTGRTWDSVNHEYKETGEGSWRCENGANIITVTNHSNQAVRADVSYASSAGFEDIKGTFDYPYMEFASAAATTNPDFLSCKFTLTLEGVLDSVTTKTEIGKITVKLS